MSRLGLVSRQRLMAQRQLVGRSLSSDAYTHVIRSPVMYYATIVGVALVGGYVYNGVTGALWNGMNRGKRFEDVEPHFKFAYDDDEEEDDE